MLKLPDEELEAKAENLQMAYEADLGEVLVSEVRSFHREFRKEIEKCESVKDVLNLLLSSDVLSSMPKLGTAGTCILFCSLLVTLDSAERSFSKLKLIKTYLHSSIAQDRLDSLALISIENEAARQLDVDELVDKFANSKARRKEFWLTVMSAHHAVQSLIVLVRGTKAMENQRDHASGQDPTSCHLLRFPTHISDPHTIPAFGEDGCTHFHLPHIWSSSARRPV